MIDLHKLRQGERRTLGRAITLVESTIQKHRDDAERLLEEVMPFTGNGIRVGVSGVPGVGKSTFIDVLGMHVIDKGHKIAVLTIDPTSSITGGSILGDKTRMTALSTAPNAFIRPSPSGLSLGGVARRTMETILICEAAGFDIIIVETVGVGQSETLVANMTDLFLLMLLPGGGDDLQGIKRGIMELADIVVVNKSDGDLVSRASLAAADVQHALHLMQPRLANWQTPVLQTSATEKTGIEQVWNAVREFESCSQLHNKFSKRREKQSLDWLWRETGDILLDALKNDPDTRSTLDQFQMRVKNREMSPTVAARQLCKQFIKRDL